jgi:enoyl-CoA hydratase
MPYEFLSVTTEERVAVLRLERPKALNALCDGLVSELAAALDVLEGDPEVTVAILTGGADVFAAGADLKEMLGKTLPEVVAENFSGCCPRLAAFGLPVVAAVAGYALGGGCELVEMCDIVIAADTARFGHPEVSVGTMPGAGGTQRLPRAIGKHKALDLLLTGRMMDAAEAERAGLVSRVVPPAELLDTALAVARRIASHSRPVLKLLKQAVVQSQGMPLGEGLAFERKLFQLTFGFEDRREGMEAFVEKRKPRFRHR